MLSLSNITADFLLFLELEQWTYDSFLFSLQDWRAQSGSGLWAYAYCAVTDKRTRIWGPRETQNLHMHRVMCNWSSCSLCNIFHNCNAHIFLNIFILLKYSWLAVVQVHSKVIQLYMYTYIIFQIILHYRLLQDIDYISLCFTVNFCCLLHIYFFN